MLTFIKQNSSLKQSTIYMKIFLTLAIEFELCKH